MLVAPWFDATLLKRSQLSILDCQHCGRFTVLQPWLSVHVLVQVGLIIILKSDPFSASLASVMAW